MHYATLLLLLIGTKVPVNDDPADFNKSDL